MGSSWFVAYGRGRSPDRKPPRHATAEASCRPLRHRFGILLAPAQAGAYPSRAREALLHGHSAVAQTPGTARVVLARMNTGCAKSSAFPSPERSVPCCLQVNSMKAVASTRQPEEKDQAWRVTRARSSFVDDRLQTARAPV